MISRIYLSVNEDKRGKIEQSSGAAISPDLCKGVPGSECRTGGRLVGCRWRLEKKKGLHQFLA